MTRKQAIKLLSAVIGVAFGALQKSGAQSFTLESGDLRPIFSLGYGKLKRTPNPDTGKYINVQPSLVNQYFPNTATVLVDMGQIETYTLVNGDSKIVITREEMWEALKG